MSTSLIREQFELGFPWKTYDPFLFCVHHDDAYPAGDSNQGVATGLAGRQIGSDFSGRDGFSMYHGRRVPGFPRHPHRGFETISIVRSGFMDHSDSLGAKARFTKGDVQWMTAGRGIQHSEMFPLVHENAPNPTGLFQVWINLPASKKMSPPHFSMLWSENIPVVEFENARNARAKITVVAGHFGDSPPPPSPPPESWASQSNGHVAIYTIELDPGAELTLPEAPADANRTLYYFSGNGINVGGTPIEVHSGLRLVPELPVTIENGDAKAELLLLQGAPIGEPIAHYGPFVMNSSREIQEAIDEYRRTEFGAWPWASDAPVHDREAGRFAVHADGRIDEP